MDSPTTTISKGLSESQIGGIVAAFERIGWHKTASQYQDYLGEQENLQRVIWLAHYQGSFSGYVTLVWNSGYIPFKRNSIPEIKDLNVLPEYQRNGIGSRLLDQAEQAAFRLSEAVGIGVGLTRDYVAAHQLYLKRGYSPDGNGVSYDGTPLEFGSSTIVDDRLCLMMTRNRRS